MAEAASVVQSKNLECLFDALWARLQSLVNIAQQVDLKKLSEDHSQQMNDLSRITCGYAHFVLECGANYRQGFEPPMSMVKDMALLINSHCDDAISSLKHMLRYQSGDHAQAMSLR